MNRHIYRCNLCAYITFNALLLMHSAHLVSKLSAKECKRPSLVARPLENTDTGGTPAAPTKLMLQEEPDLRCGDGVAIRDGKTEDRVFGNRRVLTNILCTRIRAARMRNRV